MKENPQKTDSIENENKLENESCKMFVQKQTNENHLNRNQWQRVFHRTIEFALKKRFSKFPENYFPRPVVEGTESDCTQLQ